MQWYNGSIEEAVTLSKQRNAIFVVFVEDDNEPSKELAASLQDSAVSQRLATPSFLAVKLRSGSPNYMLFAQMYQLVPVPSLFFIGHRGVPLEVVCAGVQPAALATRLDRIVEQHQKDTSSTTSSTAPATVTPNLPESSSSAQQLRERTEQLLKAEGGASEMAAAATPASVDAPETSSGPPAKIQKTVHHEVTKSGKEYDVVCEGDTCVRIPRAGPEDPGPSRAPVSVPASTQEPAEELINSESSISIEEKMERARKLIESKQKEKAEKEKEAEKQKELERRNLGQGVNELKQWQADQELKQIQEDRRREKMENNLARQRILEQIAQDRAERKARDQVTVPAAAPVPATAPVTAAVQNTAGDGGGLVARVSFKLPGGENHTHTFDAVSTLADVQAYVADNLHLSSSLFALWTAFPRRELSPPSASLVELQLAPSAALLVLPRGNNTVAPPTAFTTLIAMLTQIFTTCVMDPCQAVWYWVRARLSPTPPPTATSPTATPPPPPVHPGVRRRGNIHRLPGERAGDDENNTWNGNSTQQM